MSVEIRITGDATEFAKAAKDAIANINSVQAAQERSRRVSQVTSAWKRELAQISQRERQTEFDKMSIAQRLNALYERRATTMERISRSAGNEARLTALQLSAARTGRQISALEAQRNAVLMGMAAAPAVPGLLARGRAAVSRSVSGVMGGLGLPIGGAAVAAVAAYQIKSVMDYAGRISDLSKQLSIGAEALQAWDYAAKQSGADISNVTTAIRELQLSQVAAIQGNKEEQAAFARLGVSIEDLRRMRPEELFNAVAASVGKMPSSARQTADVIRTLGRSADQLLPAFKNGFAAAAQAAKDAGAVMDSELISRLDALGDRWASWASKLKVGLGLVLGYVLDVLTWIHARVAWVGGFIGAKLGGASWKDAKRLASEAFDDVVNADKAAGKPEQPQTIAPAFEPAEASKPEAQPAQQQTARMSQAVSADQLARLGLFVGGYDPHRNLLDGQLRELRRIVGELQWLRREVIAE